MTTGRINQVTTIGPLFPLPCGGQGGESERTLRAARRGPTLFASPTDATRLQTLRRADPGTEGCAGGTCPRLPAARPWRRCFCRLPNCVPNCHRDPTRATVQPRYRPRFRSWGPLLPRRLAPDGPRGADWHTSVERLPGPCWAGRRSRTARAPGPFGLRLSAPPGDAGRCPGRPQGTPARTAAQNRTRRGGLACSVSAATPAPHSSNLSTTCTRSSTPSNLYT